MAVIEDRLREVFGDDIPTLISRSQAADLLGVSKGTLNNMIDGGSISEVEGTKKVATADVCKFMASQNLASSDVPAADVSHILEAVK